MSADALYYLSMVMAYPDKIIRNIKTGQTIRFIRTSRDTAGRLLEMESTLRAGSSQPPAHFHPQQVEDFTVLAGELTVRIEGELKIFHEGGHLHIPQNTVHAMWNDSATDTVVNWQVSPALGTEYFFETAFGLANDSKSISGTPSLLPTALLARRYWTEFRLAKPGPVVQKILFGTLALLARVIRYRIPGGKSE